MTLFSIDLSVGDINLLRHSLDTLTISGKDAKIVASLQYKLEHELAQIKEMQAQHDAEKAAELEKAVKAEARRVAKAAVQE
jgi:hypothetical protein